MLRFILLPIVLLGACGPDVGSTLIDPGTRPAPPDSWARAGARLSPQYVEGPAGTARRLWRVLDSVTEAPCRLIELEPDRAYCLPEASGNLVYAGPNCREPYFEADSSDYEWQTVFNAADPSGVVVRLGSGAPRIGPRYLKGSPNSCGPFEGHDDRPMFEVVERLAPAALAAGSVVTLELSPTLSARIFEGDDGSRFVLDLADRIAGVGCQPELTEAGARCRPDMAGGPFADEGLMDSQCERLAILDYFLPQVAVIVGRGPYRFVTAPGAFELGRRAADGSCQIETVDLGRRSVSFGAPYPAEAWPELQIDSVLEGSLVAEVPTLPNGLVGEAVSRINRSALLLDQGTACGPYWVDGQARCLPAPPPQILSWARGYADAACQSRALAVEAEVEAPAEIVLQEGVAQRDQAHLVRGQLWKVGAALAPNSSFERSYATGQCVPASDSRRFFALGEPAAIEGHAILEFSTEHRPEAP